GRGHLDPLAAAAQLPMVLLGAPEARQAVEHGRERLGLLGATDARSAEGAPGRHRRGHTGTLAARRPCSVGSLAAAALAWRRLRRQAAAIRPTAYQPALSAPTKKPTGQFVW